MVQIPDGFDGVGESVIAPTLVEAGDAASWISVGILRWSAHLHRPPPKL